jgi:hypothetical protein
LVLAVFAPGGQQEHHCQDQEKEAAYFEPEYMKDACERFCSCANSGAQGAKQAALAEMIAGNFGCDAEFSRG